MRKYLFIFLVLTLGSYSSFSQTEEFTPLACGQNIYKPVFNIEITDVCYGHIDDGVEVSHALEISYSNADSFYIYLDLFSKSDYESHLFLGYIVTDLGETIEYRFTMLTDEIGFDYTQIQSINGPSLTGPGFFVKIQ